MRFYISISVRRPDRDKSRRIPYCYFSVPDDDVTHTRLEVSAVITELIAVCRPLQNMRSLFRHPSVLRNLFLE